MATIKDVANMANVSIATVSRAMNNSGYVSDKSRKKIQEAIDYLDFFPSEVARSLYQKKSKLIGLLLPDISNPFFPTLAKGVEDTLNESGYHVILGNIGGDNQEKEQNYIKTFIQNNISGIITTTKNTERYIKDMPLVLLDRASDKDNYAVFSNALVGGQISAKAILERSPKKILLIKGPKDIVSAQDRFNGAYSELKKSPVPFEVLKTSSFELSSARDVVKQIFENYQDVDSIIASNDLHAITILNEALRRGMKIPQDLQIIGYDDIYDCEMIHPRLSTISQPAYEMGVKAAELLIKRIENKPIEQNTICLPVSLKVRDTLKIRG